MEEGEDGGGDGGKDVGQVDSADHKELRPIPPALPTDRKQAELHLQDSTVVRLLSSRQADQMHSSTASEQARNQQKKTNSKITKQIKNFTKQI